MFGLYTRRDNLLVLSTTPYEAEMVFEVDSNCIPHHLWIAHVIHLIELNDGCKFYNLTVEPNMSYIGVQRSNVLLFFKWFLWFEIFCLAWADMKFLYKFSQSSKKTSLHYWTFVWLGWNYCATTNHICNNLILCKRHGNNHAIFCFEYVTRSKQTIHFWKNITYILEIRWSF